MVEVKNSKGPMGAAAARVYYARAPEQRKALPTQSGVALVGGHGGVLGATAAEQWPSHLETR